MLRTHALSVGYESFQFGPLDLAIAPGELIALLGANGSGKSTLLGALAGRLVQYNGSVSVDGETVFDRASHRSRVGYLPDHTLGFPKYTVREHLALLARFYPDWDAEYAEALRARLELQPQARVGSLSRGMGVKLAFVAAEAYRPRFLLLDEPTSGLDPLVRVELLELVRELALADSQRTVVYSTHLLEDVEFLANRILALRDGRLVIDTPMSDLVGRANGRSVPQILRDEVLNR